MVGGFSLKWHSVASSSDWSFLGVMRKAEDGVKVSDKEGDQDGDHLRCSVGDEDRVESQNEGVLGHEDLKLQN